VKVENVLIREMGRNESEKGYLDISATLGLETNETCAKGIKERFTLGAMVGSECIGIVSVEAPFPNNGSIYWIGVRKEYLRQGVGKALLEAAKALATRLGANSVTVEMKSPQEEELKTLRPWIFFQRMGFLPLFERSGMVYLYKNI